MSGRPLRAPLAIAAVVVLVDQLSKRWALDALDDGHVIEIVGSLRFNLAFNRGMAFSQGTGLGPVIGAVALLVVVGLLVSIGRSTSRIYPLAVGLIIGGALGNILDRMFRAPGWLRGGVIDFIDVQWWPIFNIADIAVTVGGVLLVLSTLWPQSQPAPVDGPDRSTDGADGADDADGADGAGAGVGRIEDADGDTDGATAPAGSGDERDGSEP